LSKEAVINALRGEFRRHVVNEVLRTVSGARVVDVTDYHIVLEQTERTEIVCVTLAEKERLKKEAGERGLSLSDYVRLKLLGRKEQTSFSLPLFFVPHPSGAQLRSEALGAIHSHRDYMAPSLCSNTLPQHLSSPLRAKEDASRTRKKTGKNKKVSLLCRVG